VDAQTFRDVMACLAMPVTVITALDPAGTPHGATIGSVVSLSVEPPLVMFALGRTIRAYRPLREAARFCVSVLGADQQETAERFTGDPATRFAANVIIEQGVPAVDGALGWLICDRHTLVDAGDHTVVIGRVRNARRAADNPVGPLLYHERHYHRVLREPALQGWTSEVV
jgi:flavin reductase (DIM6/NTAB) family NADH-FMN oxidoreductase RutF